MKRLVWALALWLLHVVATPSSPAGQILVEFDTSAGHNNAGGQGAIGNANFGNAQPFTSRAFPNGSLVKNASTITMTDLHLELAAGDTFDPKSTGGKAFPNVKISNNGRTIDFTGGNIKPGDSIWSMIPLSKPFPGGVGTYTGNATPVQAQPAPAPQAPKMDAPKTGTDGGTSQIHYDGAGTLSFTPGSVTFTQYSNGSITHSNTAFESIIGSAISIADMSKVGASPTIPGGFLLGDSSVSIAAGSNVYLDATLTNDLIYPDMAHPGMDIVQGTLVWQESQTGLNSQYLNELYGALGPGTQTNVYFETSILAQTVGLSTAGSSSGDVIFSVAGVPEPSTFGLLAFGMAILAGMSTRRRKGT